MPRGDYAEIVTRYVAGHRAYFFRYGTHDFDCYFSTLNEVGKPWQPYFRGLIAERGLFLKTIEIDQPPYVITVRA